jgi:hypothetical protein
MMSGWSLVKRTMSPFLIRFGGLAERTLGCLAAVTAAAVGQRLALDVSIRVNDGGLGGMLGEL